MTAPNLIDDDVYDPEDDGDDYADQSAVIVALSTAAVQTVNPALPGIIAAATNLYNSRRAPSFQIITQDGKQKFVAMYGPKEYSVNGLAPSYAEVERPGRLSLSLRQRPQLLVVTLSLTFGYLDRQKPVTALINALTAVANARQHVRISYPGLSGWWNITALQNNVTDLTLKNEPSRITSDITFTRASDAALYVGPTSGGAKAKTKKSSSSKKPSSKKPKTYKVKKGDTLFKISKKFYGTGDKAHAIADWNHLKKMKLKVGQKLKLR